MRRLPLVLVLGLLGACLELPSELPHPSQDGGSDTSSRDDGGGDDAEPTTDANGGLDAAGDIGPSPDGGRVDYLRFKQVSAGRAHACAIAEDDTLWCWGDNGSGQVDPENESAGALEPVQITLPGQDTFSALMRGGDADHTCAVTADPPQVFCWGANGEGQKDPTDSASDHSSSVVTGELNGPARLSGSATHTCVVLEAGGGLECWGSATDAVGGDDGIPDTGESDSPIVEVGTAPNASLALNTDGKLFAWGSFDAAVVPDGVENDGQNCIGSSARCDALVPWGGAATFEHLTVGADYACAIDKSSNDLWCWGEVPELGSRANPEMIGEQVKRSEATIGLGADHACVIPPSLAPNPGIDCWGGDMRNPTTSVAGEFFAVTAGDSFSCALETAAVVDDANVGHLRCWGVNSAGQLGVGDTDEHDGPVTIRVPRQ